MTRFIGPNHYRYYSVLQRRLVWLHMVSKQQTVLPGLSATIEKAFNSIFQRLPSASQLGVTKLLQLDQFLDDTPVDSFLGNIAEALDALESNLFSMLAQDPKHAQQVLEQVTESARLWGRNLGQEVVVSETYTNLREGSLLGVFEVASAILEGGESSIKPFLLRRYTDKELQFESSFCPHRKPYHLSDAGRDLACKLDSEILGGFLECISPGTDYQRQSHKNYCLNQASI